MNSIASAAIRSSATLWYPSSDATRASSASPCVRTRCFVHERIHTFVHTASRSSSTLCPQDSPRPPVGKAAPALDLTRAGTVECVVPETRPHGVHGRVQARHACRAEQVELLPADEPAQGDPDQPDGTHVACVAVRRERLA